jgi:Flp pilus assembly protein TadD
MNDQRATPPDVVRLLSVGFADHQAGRLREAEAAYQKVLALEPAQPDALHLLGVAAHQAGENERAVEYIRRAIEVSPGVAEAHSNLGAALRKLGRDAEAEAAFRESLRLRPNAAETHNNLGNLLCDLGRYQAAAESFREALRLRQDYPEARANLRILLGRLHSALGQVQFDLGRAVEAEASCREVLRLRPDDPQAHLNLSSVLRVLGRAPEAMESCREALRLRPEFPEALSNLGNALHDLGRIEEAIAHYRAALRLRPDDANIRTNLGFALLLAGQFAEGWEECEWRWKASHLSPAARDFPAPPWNGEPIGDRVILLYAEQGLGDTLQFCRYVPLVAARARVVLEAPAPLARLLSRLPGSAALVVQGEPLPAFDLHCSLMSLPRAFGTTLETIPATVPYLSAPPESVAAWRDRLAGIAGLRVGLVWAGGRRQDTRTAAVDTRRSMRFAMLAPLAGISGVSFISLQKGRPAGESANLPPGMTLHDFTAELHDLVDTAALVETLDLVISVDTAVAHLAGALGKPVWLLNRFDTDWRWLLDRDDSPWYPTLRQFRQPSLGDWASAVDAVRDALQRLAAGDREQLRPQAASGSVPAAPSA